MNRWIWTVPGSLFCLLLLAGACMMGCVQQGPGDDSRLHVTVTVLPQSEIAREIGGERVCVTVIVPPGVEPHTYEPGASQILGISKSDIYFRLGPGLLPFEDNLVERLKELNPDLLIVSTSDGIDLIHGEDGMEEEGSVGSGQGGTDPHIWLSPSNLRVMARNTGEGFRLADPLDREGYSARENAYLAKIDTTDATIRGIFSGLDTRSFMVFHPAWGYFAREYGLSQVSVEEGGREPGIRHLSTLVSFARENGIRIIFADPQHSTRESSVVAGEIDGMVVILDPLGPGTLQNLEDAASSIAGSYHNTTPGVPP